MRHSGWAGCVRCSSYGQQGCNLGLGHLEVPSWPVTKAVKVAVGTGYCHTYYAQAYQSEKGVGVALQEKL